MRAIKIKIEGQEKTVSLNDYVRVKTLQLQEFGYSTLTRAYVSEQLDRLLRKEPVTVIGMMMQNEVIEEVEC